MLTRQSFTVLCTVLLVGLAALRTFSFLGSLTRKTGRYASPRHRSREKSQFGKKSAKVLQLLEVAIAGGKDTQTSIS
jgi:hypothetical protein